MNDLLESFIVPPNTRIDLKSVPTKMPDIALDKDGLRALTEKNGKKLFELQYRLYAENSQSLLVVLQAMDAAGKDGVINHVAVHFNPQGCRCVSFKAPSTLERSHDFLWRIHAQAPARGEIAIFNRSHYEDVLAARVHELVPKKVWKERFRAINDFERLLSENRTKVVKFFLHISREEQLKRFGARLKTEEKRWKISESDYRERSLWDEYMEAFEEVFQKCSTKRAPWFVIPSDSKPFRDFVFSELLVRILQDMKIRMPSPKVDVELARSWYERELNASVGGGEETPEE